MTQTHLVHNDYGDVTAERLATELDIPFGESAPESADYVIRWGTSAGAYSRPTVLNSKRAIRRNVDKYGSLERMQRSGVNVPPFSENISDLALPVLGRSTNHTQGRDIELILQQSDLRYFNRPDYFVQYIPTAYEYHVHVAFGSVIAAYVKRFTGNISDYDPHIRNHGRGWVIRNIRSEPRPDESLAVRAIESLGLDFGRVDMILSEDNQFYVLECNTCPSLEGSNVRIWADAFRERIGSL